MNLSELMWVISGRFLMYIHNYTYIYTHTNIKRMWSSFLCRLLLVVSSLFGAVRLHHCAYSARVYTRVAGRRTSEETDSFSVDTDVSSTASWLCLFYACSKVQRKFEAVKPDKEPWRSPACQFVRMYALRFVFKRFTWRMMRHTSSACG